MLRQDARILSKHGPGESVDLDAIDLNSKEVKTYYRQCQKCWKRKADGVKLSVCSSCKITSYCSPTCQRADWKFHKDACKANREYRQAMATQDELERIESYILGTRPRPSSLEVNTEMGEFLRRFRAVIVRASNRCFGVFQGNNEMWKTHAFIVRIERLEDFPPESRGWQRYRVVDAKARPLDELYNLSGRAHDLHPTLEQGKVYHEENVRVGCVGTITTFLECNSTGQGIQLVSWAGYSPEALEENDTCEDWKAVLVESVEKASGRAG